MAYWFYYTTDGQKQGAVSEEKLKELAANGKITPGTMLEHQSGDKTVANEVKWLTFGESTPFTATPSVAPSPFIATVPLATQAIPQIAAKSKFSVKNVVKGCGCAVGIFFGLIVIAAIVSPPSEEMEKRKEEREQRKAEQKVQQEQPKAEQKATTKIPSYLILSDDEFGIGNKNREVAVRLGVIATEANLTEIANRIKRGKWKSYERTNVHFYLPGMIPGEGAWATGNFNPDLKVSILGASDEVLALAREGTYDLEAEKAAIKILENGIRDISRSLPTLTQAQLSVSAKKIAQQEGDTNKVLDKLRNIGNLAVATKTDLATTHRIVDNIMGTFGHGIEDTRKIVDILAATTVKGNMTLKELGEAFAECGETSAKSGLSVAEVCAFLATFAKGRLKGSEAGISFNEMLLKLMNPSILAQNVLNELGVRIYDSGGNMRHMFDIMQDLEKALANLTNEQRSAAEGAIFN